MELRSRVAAALESEKPDEALPFHEALLKLDPLQCLGERHQLQMGRWLYSTGRFPQAAAAFERLLACYPNAPDAGNVRLLLGIIYARDLHQFEAADRCLTQSMETLRDAERKSQCREWLSLVRTALGRPVPEG
jgi:tetratricopeptide (TPR) repeat protein